MDHQDRSGMDAAAATPSPRRSSRRKRWLLIIAAALLVIPLILLALAPTLAGSFLSGMTINDPISGTAKLGSASLSWFGSQRLENLTLLDPEGQPVGSIDSVSTDLSLWKAATGNLDLGNTVIQGLKLRIVVDDTGQTNLQRATAPSKPQPDKTEPQPDPSAGPTQLPALRLHAKLVDAHITVITPDQPPVEFRNIQGSIDLPSITEPIQLALAGSTVQGNQTGSFQLAGSISDAVSAQRLLTPEQARFNVKASVRDLPLAGIDAMAGLGGKLTTLGPTLQIEAAAAGSQNSQTLTLTMQSQNLLVDVSGKTDQKVFSLDKPAMIQLTATPEMVRKFAPADQPVAGQTPEPVPGAMGLREAVTVTVNVAHLSMPLESGRTGAASMQMTLGVDKPLVLTNVPQVGSMTIAGLSGRVETQGLAELLAYQFNADVITDAPGKLDVTGSVRNLTTDKPLALETTAIAQNVPTVLVDRIAQMNGDLVRDLGPVLSTATLTANTTTNAAGQLTGSASVNLSTPLLRFDQPLTLDISPEAIKLAKAARLTYRLNPETAAAYLGSAGPRLTKPADVSIEITELSAPSPRTGQPTFQPAATRLAATVTATPLILTDVPQAQRVNVENLRLDLAGPSLRDLQINLAASLVDPAQGLIHHAAASPIDIHLAVATGLTDSGLAPISALFTATAKQLTARLAAKLPSDLATVTLAEPATVSTTLTPGLYEFLVPTGAGAPTLGSPAKVDLSIAPATIPLKGLALDQLKLALAAKVDQLVMTGADQRLSGSAVRNLVAEVQLDRGSIIAQITGQAAAPNQAQPGPIAINATIQNALPPATPPGAPAAADAQLRKPITVKANVNIQGLPTALVGSLAGQTNLPAMIGPAASLTTDVDLTLGPEPAGSVAAKLSSELLQADAALAMQQNTLSATRPIDLTWTLTPQAFAALTTPAAPAPGTAPSPTPASSTQPLALLIPVQIKASIPQLALALPAPGSADLALPIDPARSGSLINFSAGDIALRDAATERVFTFRQLAGSLTAPRLTDPIKLALNSTIDADVKAAPGSYRPGPGTLALAVNVINLISPTGVIDPDVMTLDASAQLQQFPTIVLDQIAQQAGLLPQALGPQIQLTATAQLQNMLGPVGLDLTAKHGSAHLAAQIGPDFITLRDDATAKLLITEQLSRRFINHPLLKQAVRSENPVEVFIAAKGFQIPRQNASATNIRIENMLISPGKLVVRNAGLINTLVTLPQQIGNLARLRIDELKAQYNKNEMIAWFTPVDISLVNGVMTYGRMDMLLGDDYQIATWGRFDLKANQGRMILGIGERALRKVYGIAAFAQDPGYVDQFIMQGPLDTLGPNPTELTGRIGFLTAGGTAAQIGGKDVGKGIDTAVKILGGIGQVARELKIDKRTVEPAPAPKPYPWPPEATAPTSAPAPTDPNQPAPPPQPQSNQAAPAPAPAPAPSQPTQPAPPPAQKSDQEKLLDLGGQLLQDAFKKKN
jgi:hypothetical protein